MQVYLKLVNGEDMEQVVGSNSFIIGRSPKCDVVVPHDGMSRQHCQIELINGEVFVTDLGSTNGVLIDGQKIEPHVKTPYATYLSLSFGAVQSLQIELDEPGASIVARPSSSKKGVSQQQSGTSITTMTKTKAMDPKAQTDSKLRTKPAPKKESKASNIMVNILALLILLGAVWWYVQKENQPQDVIEEGPAPEAPQKSYDQF